MSYPNAFCVKCGAHTDTQQKHTVVLQNGARSLKGVCPSCATNVYKILPKGKSYLTKVPLTAEEQKRYPNAFCVKCQAHTPTVNAHTVLFENMSRAVTGACKDCGSEVYRILSQKDAAVGEVKAAAPAPAKKASDHRIVLTRRAESAPGASQWTYVAAAGMIVGIIAAFCAYTFL